ncbi:MAG: glycoside hydrolase family 13 protein [Bifidobacteriaceae bacterium]|nr:glycoside hydrolase family 13 protein [Bifidobacteriaceae bacterium]
MSISPPHHAKPGFTSITATELVHPASSGDVPWWRSAVVYEVYPRSFADADGDGTGDLTGLRSHLDHLAHLGVDAIWINPFYVSGWVDGGFDVIDHRGVDPKLGTIADFDAVLYKAHDLGLKVIIDLVPNHTSDQHPWFKAAVAAGPTSPQAALYVVRPGRGTQGEAPPNDWKSKFGGSAWTRFPSPQGDTGHWYLHLFDVHQPDLNWENPLVKAEYISIMRFWLERGVDGFRVDNAHSLIKADGLPDSAPDWVSPVGNPAAAKAADAVMRLGGRDAPRSAPRQDVGPQWDQELVHEVYRDWRAVLDEYPGERILVGEAWVSPPERLARYVRGDEMNQAFSFEFLAAAWDAADVRSAIAAALEALDAVDAPSTWVLSNHDVIRHLTRLSLPPELAWAGGLGPGDPLPEPQAALRRARAATLLMLALPGSAYVYQGEELGLPEESTLPEAVLEDPTWRRSGFTVRGRDGARVPLPWVADAPHFGFSMARETWLPQPPAWCDLAADRQRGVPGSTYETYRAALWLRRSLKLGTGSLSWVSDLPAGTAGGVVAFVNRSTLVVANFGAEALRLSSELQVLHASSDLPLASDSAILVPPDTTVWADLG